MIQRTDNREPETYVASTNQGSLEEWGQWIGNKSATFVRILRTPVYEDNGNSAITPLKLCSTPCVPGCVVSVTKFSISCSPSVVRFSFRIIGSEAISTSRSSENGYSPSRQFRRRREVSRLHHRWKTFPDPFLV